jgi:hypothetical protein
MVVDHLRIVNSQITDVIRGLFDGKVRENAASTASVKPGPAVTLSVIPEFDGSCSELVEVIAAQTKLQTALKYAHPWFGLMDAAEWHFMLGFHMSLHRKQMELIIAGLAPR